MSGIMGKVLLLVRKLGYFVLEYFYILLHWKLKFYKVQMQKWKKCGAQKQVDKAFAALGADIYSFYKQGGDSGWRNVPSIDQQLRRVEEAESAIFRVDEAIDGINSRYLARKDELKSTYAAKRAQLEARSPEGEI